MKIEIPIGTKIIVDGEPRIVTEKVNCNPDLEDCTQCKSGYIYLLLNTPMERSDGKCVYFRKVKDE